MSPPPLVGGPKVRHVLTELGEGVFINSTHNPMKQSTIIKLRWLRRISQAIFFCLFFWFLLRATYSSRTLDLAAPELVTTTHLNVFFKFDPLITLGHLISTHTLYPGFILSLLTIAVTAIIGRVFCGWVCPFGTLLNLCNRLTGRRKASIKTRVERGRYRRMQRLKYYILIFLLVTSALAFLQVGILDPLCLLARSFTLSIFPAANFLAQGILGAAMDSAPLFLSLPAGRIHGLLEAHEIIGPAVRYDWALLTGLILLALLVANLFYTRFWCRFLCPLGALLGLVSRFSILRLRTDDSRCTQCDKCMSLCQGGSLSANSRQSFSTNSGPRSREDHVKWRKTECLLCLNCLSVCPEDVMGFEFSGTMEPAAEYKPDLTRRGLIASIGAGLIALPLLRIARGRVNRSRLIRPPGALPEGDFLATCLRCGSCSRICPTNAIHPSLIEAGIEGLWTPRIVPRIGYCVYSCTLCGQVCPSHAIRRLTPEEKMGSRTQRPVKIGTAVVNRSRCLLWSKGLQCGACEEVCPVSPKAITLEEAFWEGPGGKPVVISGPVVDSLLCIGCGRCENVCPVDGTAAIRIFSTGEER